MSLSEISVAKDLIPGVLKVAWMMLFLSLSSCEQREGAGESPPRLEAFQKVDVPSLFTASETGRGRERPAGLPGSYKGPDPNPGPGGPDTKALRLSTAFFSFLIEKEMVLKGGGGYQSSEQPPTGPPPSPRELAQPPPDPRAPCEPVSPSLLALEGALGGPSLLASCCWR